MQVEAVPLTDFIHGDISAVEGVPIELDEGLAAEFEQAGLIRIKMAPKYANKMMGNLPNKDAAGKVLAAGQDQPSSVSPAAQASPSATLHLPKRGEGKTRSAGT